MSEENLPDTTDEDDSIDIEVEEPDEDSFYRPKKDGFTIDKQEEFIQHLARNGNITSAAEKVGVSRKTVYYAQKKSDAFAKAMKEAREKAYDRLEAAAWEKAMEGKKIAEKRDENGNVVSERYDYSDRLHKFLLEANKPEKFGSDDEQELSGEITLKVEPEQPGVEPEVDTQVEPKLEGESDESEEE